jgi:carbon monoxide dehydrogenase subunit G
MIVQESFEIPFEISASWEAFKSIPMLVSCMPGASLQSDPVLTDTGSKIDILFSVKLGPIVGSFLGAGEVAYDDPQKSGVFSGSGVDRKSGSRVRGEAKFTLSPSADSLKTEVAVVVDYSLTGPLAQFSRGAIVQELAATLTREFANNLKVNIGRLHDANDLSASGLTSKTLLSDDVLITATFVERSSISISSNSSDCGHFSCVL